MKASTSVDRKVLWVDAERHECGFVVGGFDLSVRLIDHNCLVFWIARSNSESYPGPKRGAERVEDMERFPERETERLVLREITMEDLEWYYRHFSAPEIVKGTGFPAPVSIEAAKEELELYIVSLFRKRQGFRWGIVRRGEGSLIGSCGFYGWVKQPGNRAEIGYDLNPGYWGRGIMKEALRAIIAFCVERMGLNRIEALVPAYNSRSIGLAESLGFKKEGVLRERSYFAGKYSDDVCFSLLRREWSR